MYGYDDAAIAESEIAGADATTAADAEFHATINASFQQMQQMQM